MSYNGDMEGCHARGHTDNGRRTEHEDRPRILEAEFAIPKKFPPKKNVEKKPCLLLTLSMRGDTPTFSALC